MTFEIHRPEDTLLPKFDFEFFVWPHEAANYSKETVDLLFRSQMRHVLTFTEKGWNRYRARVEQDGLVFHEVTRTPHSEPELVI